MNQNVIITGSNRGIGRAMVQAFAQNGDNVWACSRTRTKEFEQCILGLEDRYKVWIHNINIDLSSPESIKEGFGKIRAEKKSVDVLINCAGIGHMELFQMTSFETIRNIYEVNLFSLMQMCQLALSVMRRQKAGKIINIASTAAKEVYVGNSIYGASKASVAAFTKSLAAEVSVYGIQVNAIAPGLTDTEMSSVFEGKNPNLPLERSAIGRKIQPFEIADVAVTLTSKSMEIINGQMICVNGGVK